MKKIISIKEIDRTLHNSIKESLNHIEWTKIIKSDDKIALKINLCAPEDKIGVTVRPTLLEQLCNIIRSRCSELFLCESDGSNFHCEEAFRNCGIYKIEKATGSIPINLSKGPFVNFKFNNFPIRKLEMPKLLFDCDHILTLAVLKTHVYTIVSLGLKNQFGCIPSSKRFLYHPILDDMIVKLNQILKPSITIIDGTYGLNIHGPITGTPVRMNCLITSNNIISADCIGSMIMGFNPFIIPHLRKAIEINQNAFPFKNTRVYGNYKQFINYFHIEQSFLDKLTLLTLKSNIINQFILNTPLTPFLRTIIHHFSKNPISNY